MEWWPCGRRRRRETEPTGKGWSASLALQVNQVNDVFGLPLWLEALLVCKVHMWVLGPLHTWTKSRDLVMVRILRLSSKGRTMGVGKVVLCSHGPVSTMWSGNGLCCGTVAWFVGRKRGEDLVQYNMSQTPSIWEKYLVVSVCPRICLGIYHEICLGICP